MQKAAVLPALGIGDALLMMIASEQLRRAGYQVTTFHNALPELSPWFPGHNLQPIPLQNEFLSALSSFDLILVENDNSPTIQQLLATHCSTLSLFYPTYAVNKHAPLSSRDYAFNPNRPMADNIALAITSLLGLSAVSKDNGLTPPTHLIHRREKQRVLLHPTSREAVKNWKPAGFLHVAHQLRKKGFTPVFCVSPQEQPAWRHVESQGFTLADLPHLSTFAALTYESGLSVGNDSLSGHLASNLNIPSVTIANEEKRMRLWRPGWLQGQLVLPPPYLPSWKFLRQHWQHFITPQKVLNAAVRELRA